MHRPPRTMVSLLVLALALVAGVTLTVAVPSRAARGPQLGPETPVTPVDMVAPHANNSPSLAVDPTEPRFVALAGRVDGPQFDCTLHLSGDGGRSWVPAGPVQALPQGVERCYAPAVDFDGDGRLYFLFAGLHGRANTPVGIFLTRSSDRGRTFSTPRRLLGPDTYMVRLAIERQHGADGRIHLCWVSTTAPPSASGFSPVPNPIMAAFSDDGGQTFSSPVPVSGPERRRVVAPALALGPGDTVRVLYYDLNDDALDYQGAEGPTWEGGTWTLVLSTSHDGGRTFDRGVTVDDAIVPPERVLLIFTMPPPALVADAAGRVIAGWHDARNGDWDVFTRRSTDGGASWEKAVRVNDDPVGDGRHQYLPSLLAAPDGRIDAVFYDRRNDPQNLRNDVYHVFSTDGGRTFSPNLRLTSDSSDTRDGPRYGVPSARGLFEFGSHPALASSAAGTIVAWTDTRNDLPGIVQQDLVTSAIVLPGGSAPMVDRTSSPVRWLPLALVVLGAAAAAAVLRWRLRRQR